MDQREIESILYDLFAEKNILLSELDEVSKLLADETKSPKEIEELKKEKETLDYEIHELELDVGMYTEMMNKLYPSQIGECGFPCDGRCQQCRGSESYDPMYEIFTGGDY
jgi:hypothetical protein